ncbi:hypothetical protein SEA_FAUST_252 [Streptomyces phage Faust]|uniref:Uncharacterized protein n=1 Tax=Streptomyces phage Faust TaxID=2767565 RepID=A0A7G9UZ69_9CAUD|nr:hypothetical protein PP456_gp035 [Streptomyces phage Faust]QNN99324.1 hypothetical protein SEA_FAUST_252 [Streptomyces phage Faust]
MAKPKRRPQTPKNQDARTRKILDLRRGSRTTPVPSGTVYKRRPKHGSWQ